jgi:hypothetical protein
VSHTLPVPVVVGRLRLLLERLGDALSEGRADRLLATEQELASAVGSLESIDGTSAAVLSAADRSAVRIEIGRAREALSRCRRVGTRRVQRASALLSFGGRALSYTRDGDAAAAPHRTLEARG